LLCAMLSYTKLYQRLSACHRHDTYNLIRTGIEFMLLGFALNRSEYFRLQFRVTQTLPEQWTHLQFILLSQAEIKRTLAGEPHSVATIAKMLRQRRNKADL